MLGLHQRHRVAGDGQRRGDLNHGRRDCLGSLAALAWLGAGCAAAPRFAWEDRLAGQRVVLLGEVHDNAALHALRRALLQRAITSGWRPAIAMEQFDVARQDDIERARRERPSDAQHLIDAAGGRGWHWDFYRPVVALALAHALPLVAANLPDATARRLVRADAAEVLGPERARALRLEGPQAVERDPAWRAAEEREIADGHCHALPASLLPGMARAQFARDATMAEVLRLHASRGVVLCAGNGHVRKDLGVPRWLGDLAADRVWCVGFVEQDAAEALSDAFDATVVAAAAARGDPCAEVRAPTR